LGIPTVVDWPVQLGVLQVLEPQFEPTFSTSSDGLSSGRSAHDALRQAREYGNARSLGLAPRSLAGRKDRLRQITQRNPGVALTAMIALVNAFTSGWATCDHSAQRQTAVKLLDLLLGPKRRCARLLHCKRTMTIAWLDRQGLVNPASHHRALDTTGNRRGAYNECPLV
jgi:hypothetical protein